MASTNITQFDNRSRKNHNRFNERNSNVMYSTPKKSKFHDNYGKNSYNKS
jgi:hypothetical protein